MYWRHSWTRLLVLFYYFRQIVIGNTFAICHQIKQGEQEIPYPSLCPIRWMLRCMGASPQYHLNWASKQNVYANEDYLIIISTKWHFVYSRGFHFSWPNHMVTHSAECANALLWVKPVLCQLSLSVHPSSFILIPLQQSQHLLYSTPVATHWVHLQEQHQEQEANPPPHWLHFLYCYPRATFKSSSSENEPQPAIP